MATTTTTQSSRMSYDHLDMQAKWSDRWEEGGIYAVADDDPRPKVVRAPHVSIPVR